MRVTAWVDPACGWCAVTSGWLREVAERTGAEVDWRPYSLLIRDGPSDHPFTQAQRSGALGALRVLVAVLDAAPDRAGTYLASVVSQGGPPEPFADLEAALREAGVDPGLADASTTPERDERVRESMAEADAAVGTAAPIPILRFPGSGTHGAGAGGADAGGATGVAFTGPLLDEVPDPETSVALWNALLVVSATPGFYAVSRPRPDAPAWVRRALAAMRDGRQPGN